MVLRLTSSGYAYEDALVGYQTGSPEERKNVHLIYVLYILYLIYIVYILFVYYISFILHIYRRSKVCVI